MIHRLLCGDILVGELAEVSEHQGTWFGSFRPAISADQGPVERRVCEFIAFSEDFNARAYAEEEHDASEYDRFGDLVTTGSWRVQSPDGAVTVISHAPNFIGGGEVSWVTA